MDVPVHARVRGERLSQAALAVATWCPLLPPRVRIRWAQRAVALCRAEVVAGGVVVDVHRMHLDPETLEITGTFPASSPFPTYLPPEM